jgi:hypothetical protein
MTTKLDEIFSVLVNGIEDLSRSCTKDFSSYQFESSFNDLIREFGQSVFQSIVGNIPKSKNGHITILTSFGDVCFPKIHPLSTAPGGFKISPYLQECLCLAGTKMAFEEASQEIKTLKGIDVNAKQIERLCHHYGESLAQVDWGQAYNEAVQLRLPLKDEVTYAMMDGSMILTRQKSESWKEVKLLRMFQCCDRVEAISKGRNYIGRSAYVAHLGNHEGFFDKAIEVLPTKSPLVFVCDGAKWIWKWIEEYYPHSTQILDLYHCKEHLYAFANMYYAKDQHHAKQWVESCVDLLMAQKVKEFLESIAGLPCTQKHLEKEKQKLYNYLQNNETRINYGLFKKNGLLYGSGAIESANRDIIQKRMKLSGQRWTLSGAQQMLNLRVCYKSGQTSRLHELITNTKNAA